MGIQVVTLLFLSFAPFEPRAFAQNHVDLEDMTIKGELSNQNRLQLFARDPFERSDRVKYRDNFRKEIEDGLEREWPDLPGDPSSEKVRSSK